MECYRITEISGHSYGEQDGTRHREKVCTLAEYSGYVALVVKDGLLVGVTILAYGRRHRPCLPGQAVSAYFSCDDYGPGSTSRLGA